MGSFSIWHWLIVLLVVVLLFGTKKLRNLGGDLGLAALARAQQSDADPWVREEAAAALGRLDQGLRARGL